MHDTGNRLDPDYMTIKPQVSIVSKTRGGWFKS